MPPKRKSGNAIQSPPAKCPSTRHVAATSRQTRSNANSLSTCNDDATADNSQRVTETTNTTATASGTPVTTSETPVTASETPVTTSERPRIRRHPKPNNLFPSCLT